jgi:hypothetical protein
MNPAAPHTLPRYPSGMRKRKLLIAVFCAALCVSAARAAQQAADKHVVIRVTDQTGSAIPNAKVQVDPPRNPVPAKMETDEKGELALEMKPGSYAVVVTCAGFLRASQEIYVQEPPETTLQAFGVVLTLAPMRSPTADPESPKDALRISANPYHEDIFLKPDEFKALPHISVTVHNPHSDADETYSGVRVADLLATMRAPVGKEFRGVALRSYIIATGADRYQVLLALAEVEPSFHAGEVLVADSMGGKALDAHSGPFKLVVTEDKRPARMVRNLESIELRSAE